MCWRNRLTNRRSSAASKPDGVIQPLAEERVIKDETSNKVLVGKGWVITLAFDFDVSPEDLSNPVSVIVIDGDGKKHQKKADLKGILNID